MKILALSRYSRLGASSRQRIYQFLPFLERQGIEVTVIPFLDDAYLQNKYSGGKVSSRSILAAYSRRLGALRKTGAYDLIWIEKEALPWVPSWLEKILVRTRVPLVLDYDDAVFHQYDQNRSKLVRMTIGHKIDRLMQKADMVLSCNEYIAERARTAGARDVRYLPTVVDLQRYDLADFNNKHFRIGWIGTPGTQFYLDDIKSVLSDFCGEKNARVVVIGGREQTDAGDVFERVPWTEESETRNLRSLDVGIMPLRDGCWEKGKCGYKIVQYMACGIPVIASNVGANKTIIDDGVDGFLVSSKQEWADALEGIMSDKRLMKSMGFSGRNKVEREYCTQVIAPLLKSYLEDAAKMAGV
jgi:glycosyltransferase involved in cell wall biosynthesis